MLTLIEGEGIPVLSFRGGPIIFYFSKVSIIFVVIQTKVKCHQKQTKKQKRKVRTWSTNLLKEGL